MLETINNEIKAAMRAKDTIKRDVLKVVKGAIETESKKKGTVNEVAIVKKTIEGIKETNGTNATEEIAVLEPYLPKQLNEAELKRTITTYTNVQECQIRDMGKVMKWLKETYPGQYDGKLASNIVKEILK